MKKVKPNYIIYPFMIVLAVVLMGVMIYKDNQAAPASNLKIVFEGEYQVDDGEWKTYTEDTGIDCINGTVKLKGKFDLAFPVSGNTGGKNSSSVAASSAAASSDTSSSSNFEIVGVVEKDTPVITRFNHIGGQIAVNGEVVHIFDMENENLGNSTCGENWIAFDWPAEENDTVEITLHNPHRYGNKDAVNSFLKSMSTYPGTRLEEQLLKEGNLQRLAGFVILIVTFCVLGVAVFATVLKVPHNNVLWIFGCMLFFAGSFFILDAPNSCLEEGTVVFHTTARQLCMILYPMFLFALAENCLSGKRAKAGSYVEGTYAGIVCGELLYAMTGKKLIYDLSYYMFIAEFVAAVCFFLLCVMEFKEKASGKRVLMRLVTMLTLAAVAVDDIGLVCRYFDTLLVSKIVFVAIFVSAIIYSMVEIPSNIKSSIHEKELLVELEENKVSVMLSQIQPHFLYNVLNSICHLCTTDPPRAKEALIDFSGYLRENMDSLNGNEPIWFEKELDHIKKYLKLEKMRFGNKLNIVYDIQAVDFNIQPLTVQPIVENAVKHGVCKKSAGGTVTLHTERTDDMVTITVTDDGVGFDVEHPFDETDDESHMGLVNVRKRVENMPEGKFLVESEKGKGTTVTISYSRKF